MAKFTVVTACKNAARYIEETVTSVLSQSVFLSGHCELEYLVCDGASTDGTQDLVRPYERKGVTLISEPDAGLYAALAKGLQRATGDYVAYLNAGDAQALDRSAPIIRSRHFSCVSLEACDVSAV